MAEETKSSLHRLASQKGPTESALVRQLIETVVGVASPTAAIVSPYREPRGARLYVRLRSDDRVLLSDRAAQRGLPFATYVSVLVRSHLRQLSPLPKDELAALKRSVAELGVIGRTGSRGCCVGSRRGFLGNRIVPAGGSVVQRKETLWIRTKLDP